VSFGQPERELERRVAEGVGQSILHPRGRCSLELEHEIAHAGSCQSRTQEAGEQRERQGDERADLPPKDVLAREMLVDERGYSFEDRSEGDGDRCQQQRRENATHPRRGSDQPAGEQRDEARAQNEVEDDDQGLLEYLDDTGIAGDHDQALRRLTEADQRSAGRVKQEDRQWEGEDDGVAHLEKRSPCAIANRAEWIGERRVADEREAELAEREEDREGERFVAVPELPKKESEARRHHQQAEAVPGAAPPGDRACSHEHARRGHDRRRAVRRLGDVVDLGSVRDDPERYRREDRHWGDQLAAGDRHETIVTQPELVGWQANRSGYRDSPGASPEPAPSSALREPPTLDQMARRSRIRRFLSSTLFGLIGLCFFLSFATVSCDGQTTTVTGAQLVTQTVPAGGRVHEDECSADLAQCVETRASAEATLALLAAALGSLLAAFGASRGVGWCAAGGLVATLLLSDIFDPLGAEVAFHSGYVATLLVFVLLSLGCVGHAAIRRLMDAETPVELADTPADALRLVVALFWTTLCGVLIYEFHWAASLASGVFVVLLLVVGSFLIRAVRDEARFWRSHEPESVPQPPVQG
jgi:hypothetical protein